LADLRGFFKENPRKSAKSEPSAVKDFAVGMNAKLKMSKTPQAPTLEK
jgi:hypothetical protein